MLSEKSQSHKRQVLYNLIGAESSQIHTDRKQTGGGLGEEGHGESVSNGDGVSVCPDEKFEDGWW